MNAEVKIETCGDDALWIRVIHDVNAWRGACLQCFSAAEAGVTETLLALNIIPDKGVSVKLRHLIGQRFDDLAAVLASLIHDARFRVRSGHLLRLAVLRGRPASLAFVSPHSD